MVKPKRKAYDGYTSFQYLEPEIDYKAYRLVPELGRTAPYDYPISDEEEERVQRFMEDEYVISLHEHTFVCPENLDDFMEFRRQGRDWTGYEGLSISGLDAVFENFMDGTSMITSTAGWKWNDIIHDIGIRFSDIAHQNMVIIARTIEDIKRAKREGKIAMIASLEGAAQIENEVDRVDVLYGLGVRCMGIAYSEANALGGGLREANDGGLTQFGREVVARMNKLGMSIDVSHCGDRTTVDVIEASEKPIFMTHVGARSLWNTKRMKTDDAIRACAEKGGVIGVEAAPHTTLTERHKRHTLESVMEHFEYIADLAGIDHAAFGPDTLFGDHVGLHHALTAQLSISAAHKGRNFDEVDYVDGAENPGEVFPNILRWLVKHGYSRKDMKKVLGTNILRVLEETWVR